MNTDVAKIRETLLERFETLTDKQEILKAPEIKQLLAGIKDVPTEQRASYGQSVNELKKELEQRIQQSNIQNLLLARLMSLRRWISMRQYHRCCRVSTARFIR